MKIENNLLHKSFSFNGKDKNNANQLPSKKFDVKPLVGSALGVASGFGVSKAIYKDLSTSKVLQKVPCALIMAGLADIGGAVAGSIGKDKKTAKSNFHEAGFQFMNMSIPMLMVAGTLKLCENIKSLNKNPVKIVGSLAAMVSGAALATKITNFGKPKEEQRKYTIKDSVANFDDVVATIAIGFPQVDNIIHASAILPFIYTYCGSRAGQTNNNENPNKINKVV